MVGQIIINQHPQVLKMSIKTGDNNASSRCTSYELLHANPDKKMALIFPRSFASCYCYKVILRKCGQLCSACTLGICIFLLLISIIAIAFRPVQLVVNVVLIDTAKSSPTFITNTNYLSIAIDSSVISHGSSFFNASNPKVLKLMAALSPGYLRIGGTMADRLIFNSHKQPRFKISTFVNPDGGRCAHEEDDCNPFIRPNFTMSGDEWLTLNKLAAGSGFTILFDLNCLIRHENGSWNAKNAEELIGFSDRHNLHVIWELGNEPNAFRHVFNYNVNATQLAKDFYTLRKILDKYPRYRKSLLVGPDTTRPLPNHPASEVYLKTFLENADQVVDAVTWHQYYLNGRYASAVDFVDPDVFNLLYKQIVTTKSIISSAGVSNKPIWLGETSSAYGGGAPGYSNRFISSFMWLDKLGLAAKNGIDLIIRQSFFNGYYALVDDEYNPAPDWWVSVFYKTLIGPEVVPCYAASSRRVRLYCHCTNRNALYDGVPSVTVFGVNTKDTEAKIRLEGFTSPNGIHTENVFSYILDTQYTLLTKSILLNGETLEVDEEGRLPPFKPKIVAVKPYVVMPPYSLAFWVVPANINYCL